MAVDQIMHHVEGKGSDGLGGSEQKRFAMQALEEAYVGLMIYKHLGGATDTTNVDKTIQATRIELKSAYCKVMPSEKAEQMLAALTAAQGILNKTSLDPKEAVYLGR
jgi:hypothetical protein